MEIYLDVIKLCWLEKSCAFIFTSVFILIFLSPVNCLHLVNFTQVYTHNTRSDVELWGGWVSEVRNWELEQTCLFPVFY